LRKIAGKILICLAVLSMFAFAEFTMSVQAESPEASAAGSHAITAVYYQAYIWDDHDGWPLGAGEWYFKLYGGGSWTSLSAEYSRDGPGYVNFADHTRVWWTSTNTYFKCWAGEWDGWWDYTSELTLNVAFPGTTVNYWHYGSYKVGDVTHYYKFHIQNLAPAVGVISGPSSGYRKVAYTFTASGSDPEGDSITYQWRVDGVIQAATGSSLTYTFPTGATIGAHTISVRTRDYFGAYSGDSTKTFTVVNRAPTVGLISGPSSGSPGIPYTFSTTGSDPDGDTITYEWSINWAIQPATGSSLTYTFPAAGTYTVRVRTKDSHGLYSTYSSKTVTIITASISIWCDKTSYNIGNTMKVYLQVKNPGPALPVRVIINLKLPSSSLYPLMNFVVTLPAGYDSGAMLWKTFTIPTAPTGNYVWIAELRNPTTNALISQSTWNWILWP